MKTNTYTHTHKDFSIYKLNTTSIKISTRFLNGIWKVDYKSLHETLELHLIQWNAYTKSMWKLIPANGITSSSLTSHAHIEKDISWGGWQIAVPALFSLIPNSPFSYSKTLGEFSKLSALYNVTTHHFDTFSKEILPRILQRFTSVSLHFTLKPPTEYILNMWLLRIKAYNYHFSSETQEFIEIWYGTFVLGQVENTKYKQYWNKTFVTYTKPHCFTELEKPITRF